MNRLNLNSYIYAPKDDSKHRKLWRTPYNDEELEKFRRLIDSCVENNVEFFYAISPGLDITYSSDDDFNILLYKCEQIRRVGCNSFGLFFDDIEHSVGERDQKFFTSLAGAQISVTNRLFHILDCRRFLFCPTIYCSYFADKSHSFNYLVTMGNALMAGIDIMWTGDSVVSREITEFTLVNINSILRRNVVVWDNLHSNDSRQNMVNLGPYSYRDRSLIEVTRGIFLNPNTEFGANTIPITTFADWINSDSDLDVIFKNAQLDWLGDMNSIVGEESGIFLELKEVDETSLEPMEIDKYQAIDDTPPDDSDLRPEELEAFIDFFYLPFEFRPSVKEMLSVYQWLIDNCTGSGKDYEEWKERKEWILERINRASVLLDKLGQMKNRVIFRELSPYILELRWTLQHVSVLISWLSLGKFSRLSTSKDLTMSDYFYSSFSTVLSSCRVINELKMIQPIGFLFDLKQIRSFYPPCNYRLSTYDDSYRESILTLGRRWFKTHWPLVEDVDKISDFCLGAMLDLDPHLAFILCDDLDVVVGFAVCCGQIKDYLPKFRTTYRPPETEHKYIAAELRQGEIEDVCGHMSLMRLCLVEDLCDPNAVLNLFETVSTVLQLCGVDDVCVEVGVHDFEFISLCSERLGFNNIHSLTETCCCPQNIYVYSRSLI